MEDVERVVSALDLRAGEAFQVRPRPGADGLTAGTVVYPRMFGSV